MSVYTDFNYNYNCNYNQDHDLYIYVFRFCMILPMLPEYLGDLSC